MASTTRTVAGLGASKWALATKTTFSHVSKANTTTALPSTASGSQETSSSSLPAPVAGLASSKYAPTSSLVTTTLPAHNSGELCASKWASGPQLASKHTTRTPPLPSFKSQEESSSTSHLPAFAATSPPCTVTVTGLGASKWASSTQVDSRPVQKAASSTLPPEPAKLQEEESSSTPRLPANGLACSRLAASNSPAAAATPVSKLFLPFGGIGASKWAHQSSDPHERPLTNPGAKSQFKRRKN